MSKNGSCAWPFCLDRWTKTEGFRDCLYLWGSQSAQAVDGRGVRREELWRGRGVPDHINSSPATRNEGGNCGPLQLCAR
ncbi:hypothetical protein AAFF_G00304040 [Aldrovandia affinis]|uniref:Uncharacterized protein n=1 Tax=Aldrovandia affinis TaxID=143900 RepID=A0AAD7SPZ8_9TELE|nr:hypothetical protein AAFF_G00304040 [Aldrovandia affinis]